MKKVITFIAILCVIIIGFSILNYLSFHKKVLSRKSTELLKDSLLLRQVEMQGLLLQKKSVLDSICLYNKTSDSIIQEEIQKIRDNSDKILKFQKKIFQNSKE